MGWEGGRTVGLIKDHRALLLNNGQGGNEVRREGFMEKRCSLDFENRQGNCDIHTIFFTLLGSFVFVSIMGWG